uniref:Uncharacterized protein n=1 Tax=Plectus sambesii TaxID=2011161 RepID=A0A914V7D6_9BILA
MTVAVDEKNNQRRRRPDRRNNSTGRRPEWSPDLSERRRQVRSRRFVAAALDFAPLRRTTAPSANSSRRPRARQGACRRSPHFATPTQRPFCPDAVAPHCEPPRIPPTNEHLSSDLGRPPDRIARPHASSLPIGSYAARRSPLTAGISLNGGAL